MPPAWHFYYLVRVGAMPLAAGETRPRALSVLRILGAKYLVTRGDKNNLSGRARKLLCVRVGLEARSAVPTYRRDREGRAPKANVATAA